MLAWMRLAVQCCDGSPALEPTGEDEGHHGRCRKLASHHTKLWVVIYELVILYSYTNLERMTV